MVNLKIERIKAGLTQKEVAEKLNVSINTVSNWETGAKKITVDKLLTLADMFGVSTDYLLGRNQENKRR